MLKKIGNYISKILLRISGFLSRKTVSFILLGLVILVFFTQLEEYYIATIVNPFLSKIPSNSLIAILFCIACGMCLLLFYKSLKGNKKISNWFFVTTSYLFVLFVYSRFNGHFLFSPYNHEGVKYFDISFVFFGYILILKLICWAMPEKGPIYFQDPFYLDLPLRKSGDDLYRRKEFAFELAKKIQSKIEQENCGALAIGINGEWGSGKTSFCHFIKEALDENRKNRIIIDFNPWRSSSASKIIEDFFELLIDEIKKFDPGLSNDIGSYAKTLTEIDENAITKGLKTISDFFFDGANKNENYERINQAIQKCKKQIIIFIDDLDRLDKKEIAETLRLIRNTANFNNVVYVVCYDKTYVTEAIRRFNKHNYQNFLEKIFQFEFLLPKYDKAVLRSEIKDILKKSLGPIFNSEIDASVDYAGVSGKNITNRVINSQRDVIRFTNAFLFELKKLRNEVNLIDFYCVQLLKIKFPDIYKFISDHSEVFFIRENKKFRLRTFEEKNTDDNNLAFARLFGNNDGKVFVNKLEGSIFEGYINGIPELSNIQKDVVIDIMMELLKHKHLRSDSESIDYKSFVFVSNFQKYFSIQLLETDFSSAEFEKARFENFERYESKVMKWIEEGRIADIQDRLEKIVDFQSKQEWENHLNILVVIGKYQNSKSGPYGINYVQILQTLNYPNKKNGFDFFSSESEYHAYLINFFKTAPDPYVFESNLLTASFTPYASINLSIEEVFDLVFDYFKSYCANHSEITHEFRELYRNCVRKRQGYYDQYDIVPEADKLFRKYFRKNLTGCLLSGFIKHTSFDTEFFHIDLEWLNQVFTGLPDFEEYLSTAEHIKKQTECYEEFLAFYFKNKENGFKPIEYRFDHLKPNRWISN